MVTNNFAVALQQVSMGYQDTGIRVVSNDVDVNTLTIKVYNAGAEIAYNELSSGTITFVKEDRNVVQADLTINATWKWDRVLDAIKKRFARNQDRIDQIVITKESVNKDAVKSAGFTEDELAAIGVKVKQADEFFFEPFPDKAVKEAA
jgi:hypothetical protein